MANNMISAFAQTDSLVLYARSQLLARPLQNEFSHYTPTMHTCTIFEPIVKFQIRPSRFLYCGHQLFLRFGAALAKFNNSSRRNSSAQTVDRGEWPVLFATVTKFIQIGPMIHHFRNSSSAVAPFADVVFSTTCMLSPLLRE